MPGQILDRITKAWSSAGDDQTKPDLVLDPFAGSGTTVAVARKLGRRYLGIELSKQYAQECERRLDRIHPGDPLDGAENPLASVPNTANGKVLTLDGRRVKRNGAGEQRRGKRTAAQPDQPELWT